MFSKRDESYLEDRGRAETGPVETGISPVENFEKYPVLNLFWP
jgi:hypothetical protein